MNPLASEFFFDKVRDTLRLKLWISSNSSTFIVISDSYNLINRVVCTIGDWLKIGQMQISLMTIENGIKLICK